jgi:hypothetical protein
MLEVAFLASFCNDQGCCKERSFQSDSRGEHGVEAGFSLEHAQFFEGAVEGALEAGVMAGEAIGKGIEEVDSGFEDADTAEIPSGGDEFVE